MWFHGVWRTVLECHPGHRKSIGRSSKQAPGHGSISGGEPSPPMLCDPVEQITPTSALNLDARGRREETKRASREPAKQSQTGGGTGKGGSCSTPVEGCGAG
ncbi:hypothetical protein GCM10018952_17440 [Streptosporangium vulgare]